MMLRSLLLRLALFAGLIACGSDSNPVGPLLPLTGRFADTLDAGETSTLQFVAGRSGATTVAICAPEGTNFDLTVGGQTSATASNCERVTFGASASQAYRIDVRAVSGSGPVNGCWSIALVICTVEVPLPVCAAQPPAVTDPAIPAGYYSAAERKCGGELIATLHSIIRGQRVLGYTSARDSLYANVDDPDNDDVVIDVYTGRAANVNSRSSAAAAGFNTEHGWPQSRGSNEDPAMSDLHHLFSSDETANAQRLNYPFGVVTGTVFWTGPDPSNTGERSRLGLNAAGQTVFEPRASKKGDIARAILYFYIRYRAAPTPSFTLANFNVEEMIIIQWALDDPPDTFEKQRNNLTYRSQGNRNPFVDRPDFLAAVGDWPN